MKREIIDCSACDGTGEVPLSEPMMQTLRAVHNLHPCTTSEIYTQLRDPDIHRSTINQRVKKLLALKLIKSEKIGRALRVYRPV